MKAVEMALMDKVVDCATLIRYSTEETEPFVNGSIYTTTYLEDYPLIMSELFDYC